MGGSGATTCPEKVTYSEFGPPWEGAEPLYIWSGPPGLVQDLHMYEPYPWNGIRTPLYGARATHGGVPGQSIPGP
jgi:hypothetical protein